MKKRKIWTKTEIDVLIHEYPNVPTSELAKRFETSLSSVYAQAYTHGLQKSDAVRLPSLNREASLGIKE